MATLISPTLQNLLSETRILLGQKNPLNSNWDEAELTNYINEGVRLYFIECVRANEGYFTTQTDLNIVAGSETIALPADCFEIRTLYRKVSNGYMVLPYRNSMTEGYFNDAGTGGDTYLPYYFFRGNSIVLRDTPQFSEVAGLRLEYMQFPDTMIYGGDTLTNQVSPVFKQLIVMYAVYKAKLRESMVNGVDLVSIPKSNLNELYGAFKEAITKRSKNPTYVIPFNPEAE